MTEENAAAGQRWAEGMACRVVEHDDATRRPVPGGRVIPATVCSTGPVYVRARSEERGVQTFYLSGWLSGDGTHRWKLVPEDGS